MPEGRIIKALAGFYYVLDGERTVQCRARGVFKKKGITPLVGDRVDYEHSGNEEGFVTHIHPRTSELIRPPIANVNQAVIVCSLKEPAFNPLLLDKFLVHAEIAGITAVICFSKCDLWTEEEQRTFARIKRIYSALDYPVLHTSSVTGEGLSEMLESLQGNLSVFAGPSGVGKSSLLNAMLPDLQMETGAVSRKLGRGRHTTRHVELIALPQSGFVADTPGFSQLDFKDLEPEELAGWFPEMHRFGEHCKFRGCLHMKEPGCAVKEAVKAGDIDETRYENYKLLLEDVKEKKARRY